MGRLTAILGISAILSSIIPFYFFWQMDLVNGGLTSLLPLLLGTLTYASGRKEKVGKLDKMIVTAVIHMYAVSLGEVGSLDIIDAVASSPEYGKYCRIFKTVKDLAVGFGHGLTKALTSVAKAVKPPLRDVLIRMTEAFSTTTPRDFLELESSTILEEFSGYYTRSLESLKVIGGVFSTFQSISIFIVLTVAILTIFTANEYVIPFAYAVSVIAIVFMVVALKVVAPKETLVYVGDAPPHAYKLFKATLALVPASFVLALAAQSYDLSLALLIPGVLMLAPGLLAYKVEKSVLSLDEYYPSFIKALGENLASTLNLRAALEYAAHIQLGPLGKLVRKVIVWLKLGINYEKSLKLMALESGSHLLYIFNKILSDTLKSGSPPLEVSKLLANTAIRFLEFRKRRISTAKGIETAILILQPISVFILVTIAGLLGFFGELLTPTTYFPFYSIPTDLIELGNIFLVFSLALTNAYAIIVSRGGFKGTFFLYASILLIISWASWFSANLLINNIFSQFKFDFLKI